MCQSTAESSHSYILTRNCVLLTERHDRHGFVQLFFFSSSVPSPTFELLLLHNAKVETVGETIFQSGQQAVFLLERSHLFHAHTEKFRSTCTATQARPQIGPPQPHVALTGIIFTVHFTQTTPSARRRHFHLMLP